jgi:hypothetical protein
MGATTIVLCWCGKPAVAWELAIVRMHPLCEEHCTQREVKITRQPIFGPGSLESTAVKGTE